MNHNHPLVKKNGKIIIKMKTSFWMHGSLICGMEYMECEKRISIIKTKTEKKVKTLYLCETPINYLDYWIWLYE